MARANNVANPNLGPAPALIKPSVYASLPKFSPGQDAAYFKRQFLAKKDAGGLSDAQICGIVRALCYDWGQAVAAWFESTNWQPQDGLNAFWALFEARYGGVLNAIAAGAELATVDQKVGEDFQSFFSRVQIVAQRGGLNEAEVLRHAINRSLPNIMEELLRSPPADAAAALATARKAELTQARVAARSSSSTLMLDSQPELLSVLQRLERVLAQHEGGGPIPDRGFQQEQQYNNHSNVCDYCFIPGHMFRDCRRRQRDLDQGIRRRDINGPDNFRGYPAQRGNNWRGGSRNPSPRGGRNRRDQPRQPQGQQNQPRGTSSSANAQTHLLAPEGEEFVA